MTQVEEQPDTKFMGFIGAGAQPGLHIFQLHMYAVTLLAVKLISPSLSLHQQGDTVSFLLPRGEGHSRRAE